MQRAGLIVLLTALSSACAAGSTEGGDGVPTADASTKDTSAGGDTNGGDDTGGDDTASPEDTGSSGETGADSASDGSADSSILGTSCTSDADCTGGLCIDTKGGKICTVYCPDEMCRGDFFCGPGPMGGAAVCWPRFDALCKPCKSDDDCRYTYKAGSTGDQAACVRNVTTASGTSEDLGSFCGASCDITKPCPTGYDCITVEGASSKQCVKADRKCDCEASYSGKETTCAIEISGVGKCLGKRTCGASGAPTACDAKTPSKEVCNGLDDDCNGTVDDGGDALCMGDALSCTSTKCMGAAGCKTDVLASTCLIGGACYDADARNPANACDVCKPATKTDGWTTVTPSCVIGGVCYAPGTINPSNSCQLCDPTKSTSAWSNSTSSCTIGGVCYAAGATNPATGSCQVCDPTASASSWTLKADTCLIGGKCYAKDATNGATTCQACEPAKSTSAWTVKAGSCLIGGACYTSGTVNPGNSCEACLPCDASPVPAGATCSTSTLQAQSKTTWSDRPATTVCAAADSCHTTGYCSAGSCSWPLKQDSSEPNNTPATAKALGNGRDCDGDGHSGSGILSGSTDADWFSSSFDDVSGCSVNPRITTSSGSVNVQTCVYMRCKSGDLADIDCADGATASTSSEGWRGCCKTGISPTFSITPNCPGLDDSNNVKVVVRNLSSTAVCADYSWTMHY